MGNEKNRDKYCLELIGNEYYYVKHCFRIWGFWKNTLTRDFDILGIRTNMISVVLELIGSEDNYVKRGFRIWRMIIFMSSVVLEHGAWEKVAYVTIKGYR